MSKWDGHTHTEYCPHGTVESLEELIQKAIQLNFTKYSVTEHAPLPKKFELLTGGPAYPIDTAGMNIKDVPSYIQEVQRLKKKYASDIEILLGFEVDYSSDFQDWTRDFLEEYGPVMDDGILSVHFLQGKDGLRAIDYTAEGYEEGLVNYHGSFQQVRMLYFQEVLKSIQADLGKYKPKRIGHISLCQKFQLYFSPDAALLNKQEQEQFHQIVEKVVEQNLMLDFNTAGLSKEYCKHTYPPIEWLDIKPAKQINWVYGSDSHDLKDIGRNYKVYEDFEVNTKGT